MQLTDPETESEEDLQRPCKFCGRRSCKKVAKIGISTRDQMERAPRERERLQHLTSDMLGGLPSGPGLMHEKAVVEEVRTGPLSPELPHRSYAAREFKPLLSMRRLWVSLNLHPFGFTLLISLLALLISSVHKSRVERHELPEGVCYWQQSSLINNVITPNCPFEIRDPKFKALLGTSPKLELVAITEAHEGGVYFPDMKELYFSAARTKKGLISSEQNSEVRKVKLRSREVATVIPVTDVASGMVLDLDGNLLICQQGQGDKGGYIQKLDLRNGNTSIVADNWFGVPFNSPNDVVVKQDGSIWFTDTTYGWVKGFRSKPRVQNQIYRVMPGSGLVDAMAAGFSLPNGLAFSEDEKLLYVTDTGYKTGNGEKLDEMKPHHIYVFNVNPDGSLGPRRFFAAIGIYDGKTQGLGVPDGIKVDTRGRVYTGSVDGVQVFDKKGKPLGLIRMPGVTKMGFGDNSLNKLYILNDTSIHSIELQATGAGLHYASKVRKLWQ